MGLSYWRVRGRVRARVRARAGVGGLGLELP